jgi:uncharacterized protein
MIDVNVSLSRWPFRRLPHDDPAALWAKLRRSGITQAWAGTFDGALHKDLRAANLRLAEECRRFGAGLLIPFGSVNPALPGWEDDLRRCAEQHRMPGVRLHPNYHGYALDDARLARLLSLAAAARMVVQIALSMEDERTQHPLARVAPAAPAPLEKLAGSAPGVRLVLLNRNWASDWKLARRLSEAGQVYFEFAMLEGLGQVKRMLDEVPADRVLLGSHFPFYCLESALLKVREAGLDAREESAVLRENAPRVLERSR